MAKTVSNGLEERGNNKRKRSNASQNSSRSSSSSSSSSASSTSSSSSSSSATSRSRSVSSRRKRTRRSSWRRSNSRNNNDVSKERRSRSKRPNRSPTPRPTKIHIRRLTKNVNKEHIEEIFGIYGKIKEIDFPKDRIHPHLGRGFAYIEFTTADEAENAIKHMHGAEIDGNEVTVASISIKKREPSPVRRYRPFVRRRIPVRYHKRCPLTIKLPRRKRRMTSRSTSGSSKSKSRSRSPNLKNLKSVKKRSSRSRSKSKDRRSRT